MKRIAIHILIVLILCGVFCDGYFSVSLLSSGRIWRSDSEVYAADSWESVTQDDLVTAFQYYCKSRNLTIDGSIADALTSFTSTTFNNICNTLGIDVNSLQANLKKTVEGNLGLRFLMNQQGVLAYNRIFAEFLQNNDLEVGDVVDNKQVWSGKSFTDDNGNTAVVFEIEKNSTWDISIKSYGSPYVYTNSDLVNMAKTYSLPHNVDFNINNQIYTMKLSGGLNTVGRGSLYWYSSTSQNTYWLVYNVNNSDVVTQTGYSAIIFDRLTSKLYLCIYDKAVNCSFEVAYPSKEIVNGSAETASVNITTNNNTINNNNYNNNYTIIYNDGDTYLTDDDDEPVPSTQPGGGGGGGDDPDQPSPSGPDLPDWGSPSGSGTIGSDGTFDFDIPFSLPDLNIDWSLKNIGNKFPFCIPSDIVSFYQVLAVEPEAPAIDAHIPLGSFYDWHFEADFSQYDNWARIIRIVEYVGFVISLIYFTVKLVKG